MRFWAVIAFLCLFGCSAMEAFAAPAAVALGPAVGPLKPEELYGPRRLMARVSPSGRYLALVQRVGDKDRLVVIDLQGRTRSEIYNDPELSVVNIRAVIWKGDDRLVFSRSGFNLAANRNGEIRTRGREDARVGVAEDVRPLNLFAISRLGGAPVALSKGENQIFGGVLDSFGDDDGHVLFRVLVVPDRRDGGMTRLGRTPTSTYRLLEADVATGSVRVVEEGGQRTYNWGVDRQGRVNLRYDVYGRRGGTRVYGRDEGGDWNELFSIREKDFPALQDMEILGQSSTPGKLYVAAKPKDRSAGDTRELRIYDFATRTMGEKLWSHPRFDLDAIEQFDDGSLAAACYWADVYRCDYFEKALQAEAEGVRRFFDNERSIRISSSSRDDKVQILSVSGPDEPGSLYLFNRVTAKVEPLGSQWPRLAPDRLGVMKPWTWTASDGATLSGYLTTPPPSMNVSGPLPLIVMPHGGPEVRDTLSFDSWAQAFATRGYLVYQPNFRGSGGFGAAFAEQGYGQWGLRMQEDVIDGVEALIKQGKVDPNRICIVGASYGGYVALQGGATRPDLFRCVISRAGVSDLIRSQEWEKDNFDEDSPRYQYWLKSIGDPKAEAEKLRAASPISYASRYQPPVLLLHGDEDWVVPVEQSEIMEKALKKAGRPVTLTVFRGAAHADWPETVDARALSQMLEFVDKYIGPAASSPPARP